MRIDPRGNARSSEITTSCSIGDWVCSFDNRHETACPLRFMKVCGFASFVTAPSISPRPTRELHSRRATAIPSSWANLSISMNPRLWRVHSYSFPGFPKPTINIRHDYKIFRINRMHLVNLANLVNPVQKLTRIPRPLLPSCPCQSLRAQRALHLQPAPQARPLPSQYRQ